MARAYGEGSVFLLRNAAISCGMLRRVGKLRCFGARTFMPLKDLQIFLALKFIELDQVACRQLAQSRCGLLRFDIIPQRKAFSM